MKKSTAVNIRLRMLWHTLKHIHKNMEWVELADRHVEALIKLVPDFDAGGAELIEMTNAIEYYRQQHQRSDKK